MSLRSDTVIRAEETPDPALGRGGIQTAALVLPALAMLVHVSLGYAVVNWACAKGSRTLVHVTAVLTLAVALAAGALALREWQRAGRGPSDARADPRSRGRFLGVLGLASSALFALMILAQWFANAFLSPCDGA